MVKLDELMRARIRADAAARVARGESRRYIYKVQKKQYGQSVGKDTFHSLFTAKVERTKGRITKYYVDRPKPKGIPGWSKWKNEWADKLGKGNLLPWEVNHLMGRLKSARIETKKPDGGVTVRYVFTGGKVLDRMIEDRKTLYNRFLGALARSGSRGDFDRRWREYVHKWYSTTAIKYERLWEAFMRRRGVKPLRRKDEKTLLMKWFGHHNSKLSYDLQYHSADTPRSGKRRQQKDYKPTKDETRTKIRELTMWIDNPDTQPGVRTKYIKQRENWRRSIGE